MKKQKFYISYIIIAINVLVFLLEIPFGGSESTAAAYLFGAQYTPAVLGGQWWRLFTCMFIHFGIMHLGSNMLSLFALGPWVETLMGRWRFIVIYLCSGLFGSLVTMLFELGSHDYSLSAGASGAIFGLLGMILSAIWLRPSLRRIFPVKNVLLGIGINLYYGIVTPNISMTAHLGGLVCGFALTAVMLALPRRSV